MEIDKYLAQTAPLIDKAIEKYLPRTLSKQAILFRVNEPRYAYNLKALNRAVSAPIWEFLDRGGKRWRPALFLLICEALGKSPRNFLDFAIIPELIHNGTLMVDDIEDSSECRRGKPCTYKIYGVDVAINSGNAMYYLALLPLIENREKLPPTVLWRIYEIYVQEMINLSLGQAMDIAWHRGLANADDICEDDYMQMCAYKTGTLARMAAKIAATLAGGDQRLVGKMGEFAESLGIAFQMQDDVLDLTSTGFAKKKGGRGSDITEGKRSFPVIHTLGVADAKDRKRLITILGMHTSNQKLKDEAIGIIEKYDSIHYAKRYAQKIVQESWRDVSRLLPKSGAKQRLKAFAGYLTERNL